MPITLPRWYDLHVHLRQDGPMKAYIKAQLAMGCAGILAMPNTKPPVAKVLESDPAPYWSLEAYLGMIRDAGGDAFDEIIVPLYLTKDTSPDMIKAGAQNGLLKACKYYPPHGTTGAEFGCPLDVYMENGVLAAMQEAGIILCIHGEEHHLPGEKYFDRTTNAEEIFYKTRMPKLVKKFPKLKIVCEHITTKVAADFVRKAGKNVAASITPQHLLYTTGHLVQGLKYHLFCLPLVKFEEDRKALRDAVINPKNTQFFAGTDSAPHAVKATPCGCAAGCFTGGIAPQLYAQGFEAAGLNLDEAKHQKIFKKFLCENGAHFYGLPISKENFTLTRKDSRVENLKTDNGDVVPMPLGMGQDTLPWSID